MLLLFFLNTLWLSREKTQFITRPPPPPTVSFLRLIKHIFCHPGRVCVLFCFVLFFLFKVAKIWNFGTKLQLNSAIWVSSRFSRSKHTQTMWMCCGVAATVLSDSAASLSGYVASTAASKKKKTKKTHTPAGTKTGVRDGTDGPAALPGCFLNDVGDFCLAVD